MNEKGFTLIELLVVAAIIAILLALAIPNLIKAKISAYEANARKSMQTLRDAEYEFFDQDLNNLNGREFTPLIGELGVANSLRDPDGTGDGLGSLVDNSFERAIVNDGDPVSDVANCEAKSGYCIGWSQELDVSLETLSGEFGWEASPRSIKVNGVHDFSVFADSSIRCIFSTLAKGEHGQFESQRSDPECF